MFTPRYHYRVFDVQMVYLALRHRPPLGRTAVAAVGYDGELSAVTAALADGYRWVRTEGDLAVFEKTCDENRPVVQG